MPRISQLLPLLAGASIVAFAFAPEGPDVQPEPAPEGKAVKQPEAAGNGAQIICLQELYPSRYFCQGEDADLFKLSEPT